MNIKAVLFISLLLHFISFFLSFFYFSPEHQNRFFHFFSRLLDAARGENGSVDFIDEISNNGKSDNVAWGRGPGRIRTRPIISIDLRMGRGNNTGGRGL